MTAPPGRDDSTPRQRRQHPQAETTAPPGRDDSTPRQRRQHPQAETTAPPGRDDSTPRQRRQHPLAETTAPGTAPGRHRGRHKQLAAAIWTGELYTWVCIPATPFLDMELEAYTFVPGEPLKLTLEMKQHFEKDGYILVR